MCGIIGYIGKGNANEILHSGLKKLTYRGYDSFGFGFKNGNKIEIIKDVGDVEKIENLEVNNSNIGISHTRWATHGSVTKANAHPHLCCENKVAVVHNGIIENYQELKNELLKKGHKFSSETDTEVVSHLIEDEMKNGFQLIEAVRNAVSKLNGSYALVIMHKDFDGLIGVRKDSPLIVGVGDNEYFIASDVNAFMEHTKRVVYLDDGEMVVLK